MPKDAKPNWKALFNRPLLDLTDDELTKCRHELMATKMEDIPTTEYKHFLELSRFLLKHMENEVGLLFSEDPKNNLTI